MTMRIGIVCPYSFDTPGGVQFHVRDLAEILRSRGHHVSVLAPANPAQMLPGYVTSVGRALPVRYNGSVARLAFGPKVVRITQAWLDEGDFDVVHIHEPFVPSCSLIALQRSRAPVVSTFHSAQERSRVLVLAEPFTRPGFEKISARIAVSQDARLTIVDHFDNDAVVIPNGVYVDRYATATPRAEWQGGAESPTIVFLGRIEEPRKGLPVLLGAVPAIRSQFPRARFLIAGGGKLEYDGPDRDAVVPLGPVSEDEKRSLLASADIYVAPQTGGESFGIVLVEAMSAGTTVVASDLRAFRAVLDNGKAGFLFDVGDSDSLADTVIQALTDEQEAQCRKGHARQWVRNYDWPKVATEISEVYAMVSTQPDIPLPHARGLTGRIRSAFRRNR